MGWLLVPYFVTSIYVGSDTPILQPSSTHLNEHSLHSMSYVQHNDGSWDKKRERDAINSDDCDLGGGEDNDDVDGAPHVTASASSTTFDTQQDFDMMLGTFDSLTTLVNTRFDAIKQR